MTRRATATTPRADGAGEIKVDVEQLPSGDVLLRGFDAAGEPITRRYSPGEREHAQWLHWLDQETSRRQHVDTDDEMWQVFAALAIPLYGLIAGTWYLSQGQGRRAAMIYGGAAAGVIAWWMLLASGLLTW